MLLQLGHSTLRGRTSDSTGTLVEHAGQSMYGPVPRLLIFWVISVFGDTRATGRARRIDEIETPKTMGIGIPRTLSLIHI